MTSYPYGGSGNISPAVLRGSSFMNDTAAHYTPKIISNHADPPADKDNGNTKEEDNSILRRFAETTTLQGPILIINSENNSQRILWITAFLIAIGCWIFHSYYLINTYLKFGTKSDVTVGYDTLDFPSVTICNVNPIVWSKADEFGSDELYRFLDDLAPNTDYTFVLPEDEDSSSRRKRRRKRQSNPEDYEFYRYEYADVHQSEEYYDDYFGDGDESSDVKEQKSFKAFFSSLPQENRTNLGQAITAMILDCSFNGLQCNESDFSMYQNAQYGNCYTFNSVNARNASFRSRLSGAIYGLTLNLFTQEYEYVEGLSESIGFRIAVHEYGTLPFVEDNGIALSSGQESFIAIRRFNSSLLGGKFGECGDNGDFKKYFKGKYKYTIQSCTGTCLERQISKNCKCYRGPEFHLYSEQDLQTLPDCSSSNKTRLCSERYARSFSFGNFDCGCRQACRSVSYEITTSNHKWPQVDYWYELIDSVCEGDLHACRLFRNVSEDDRYEALDDNFLRVRLFYRELNFESIAQKQDYELEQFISDLGGAVGLYVGATIITVIELVHLLCQCGCKGLKDKEKKSKKKRAKAKHSKQAQKPSMVTREDPARFYYPDPFASRSSTNFYGDSSLQRHPQSHKKLPRN